MKTEKQIIEVIQMLRKQDKKCPALAHQHGNFCLDFGHAIRGSWIAVLSWIIADVEAPWD